MHRIAPLVVLAGLLAGCGGGGTANDDSPAAAALKAYKKAHPRLTVNSSSDDVYVTVATADKSTTLDPHNTSNGGDVKVIKQIYQTLVRIHPTDANQLIPELAESWTIADDGMSLELKIRAGVKFHDGAQLDATAAKLSLDRLIGFTGDVPIAPYRGEFQFVERIEADGMTLTIHLKSPVARVALRNLSMFSASIVSPKLLEVSDHAVAEADQAKAGGVRSLFISEWAAGTGPYMLSSFNPTEAMTRLAAFEDYWEGAPTIKRLVFRQVADPNSQIESLKSAEVDVLDDPPRPVWDALEANPDIMVHRWWALNICYLGVNVKHDKTKELPLREATRLAIDRNALRNLYYGTARPTFSLVSQPMAEYDPDFRAAGTDQSLPARQAAAKTKLTEAGAAGRKLKLYYPNLPRPYLPTPDKVADKLRQQLNAIGLDVEIVGTPNAELFNKISQDIYELVLIGWMSDNGDPDNFYMPLASGDPETGKPSNPNAGRVFDATLHEMIVKAQTLTDQAERVTAYREIERYLQKNICGHVPLVNTQQAIATGKRITGVEVDPVGHYRFHKATLKP